MEYGESLGDFSLDNLEQSGNICYALNNKLELTYYNPAYENFAMENGGSDIIGRFGIGSHILDAISGELKGYFSDLFGRTIGTSESKEFEYECSGKDVYRLFKMLIYPLSENRGLLLVHSLISSGEHKRPAIPFILDNYADVDGTIHQCSHCRRIKRNSSNTWDWCPDSLNSSSVSHGLCNTCLDFYYPDK